MEHLTKYEIDDGAPTFTSVVRCRAAKTEGVDKVHTLKGTREALSYSEEQEPATTAENPQHKEDFNSLLGAAVPGPQSEDQT